MRSPAEAKELFSVTESDYVTIHMQSFYARGEDDRRGGAAEGGVGVWKEDEADK